jgi:hypothetical protein
MKLPDIEIQTRIVKFRGHDLEMKELAVEDYNIIADLDAAMQSNDLEKQIKYSVKLIAQVLAVEETEEQKEKWLRSLTFGDLQELVEVVTDSSHEEIEDAKSVKKN